MQGFFEKSKKITMQTTHLLAKHLKEVHLGENWTWSNLKDNLEGISWQQATTKIHSLNTIAVLVYHINYYIVAQTKVLQGGFLDSHDKDSFDCPPITSQEDWEQLVQKTLNDAENLANIIEKLSDNLLDETFVLEKYGTYYRNFLGVIEHTHYHLGQIALLKKLVT
jgi:hypothetical protein